MISSPWKIAVATGVAALALLALPALAQADESTPPDENPRVVRPHPLFPNLWMLEPGGYDWILGFPGDCVVRHWSGRAKDAPYAGHLKATSGVLVERGAQPTRVDWPDDEWSEDWDGDGIVGFWVGELTAIIAWSALAWPGYGYGDATGDCDLVHTIVRTDRPAPISLEAAQ